MADRHPINLPLWLQALLKPQAYPYPARNIELRQTQMSFVLLTGDYAYKIKKAVDLGYLDYTTLERRRYFCHQEVKLNRRLCRGVYLGVVPIRSYRGKVTWGKRGGVFEYAVKMRQLDESKNLDQLLAQDQVTSAMMRRLAKKMARFHARAATSPEISRFGELATIRQNWEENFSQTWGYTGRTLSLGKYQAIKDYVEGFMKAQGGLFSERIERGRIRDCHGDLHAAHVNFAGPIYVYDCIEFNDRFRYGDVASEIAFLVMDLDFHHRPDLGRLFVDSYIASSGDEGLSPLLPFYLCYRAYVRGKVEGFKLDDPHIPAPEKALALAQARRYFNLAHSYFTQPEKPLLIITTGLVATGKTALAQALAPRLGAKLISSDPLRKELAGIPPQEHRFEGFGQGLYSPQFTRKTYHEMFRRAGKHLAQGRWVILDATFGKREQREEAKELARSLGAEFMVIETVAPDKLVRQRLERRLQEGTFSDARWETYVAEKARFEPVEAVFAPQHIRLDTSPPIENLVQAVVGRLEGQVKKPLKVV